MGTTDTPCAGNHPNCYAAVQELLMLSYSHQGKRVRMLLQPVTAHMHADVLTLTLPQLRCGLDLQLGMLARGPEADTSATAPAERAV